MWLPETIDHMATTREQPGATKYADALARARLARAWIANGYMFLGLIYALARLVAWIVGL
jgi:hypothetical protein